MSDTEAQLTRNEVSHEVVRACENPMLRVITCDWLSTLGYPFQYRINEAWLSSHGWEYNIQRDAWIRR